MNDSQILQAMELFADVETATTGHFRDDGFTIPEIQCITDGVRIVEAAYTVSLPGDDGTALVKAVSEVESGKVLVIERPDYDRHACLGAVMNAAASSAGVIDGYVTDVTALRISKVPVWCGRRSPVTTKKRGAGTVGGNSLPWSYRPPG